MTSQLFLASTPLHILNAVAIASNQPGTKSCLWLIDQPVVDDNPYFAILSSWAESPFNEIRITQGHIRGLKKKLQHRRSVFREIAAWCSTHAPDVIYTGNDRRIEFQYAMHCSSKNGRRVSGVYMDEGTFTYVGRKASASFSDQVVDNSLKKLTYGFWWKNPPTIGGSAWIDTVYAAFPTLVHPLLLKKRLIELQPLHYNNPVLTAFCAALGQFFGAPVSDIQQLDCVLTLPHESIIDRIPGYLGAIKSTVEVLQSQGIRTGVKYHPRNSNPDILDAQNIPGFTLLPHRIPFEALLPLLRNDILVIGDVSSTLINARWLKPDASLISVELEGLPQTDEFGMLFRDIGVNSIPVSSLEATLLQSVKRTADHAAAE